MTEDEYKIQINEMVNAIKEIKILRRIYRYLPDRAGAGALGLYQGRGLLQSGCHPSEIFRQYQSQ